MSKELTNYEKRTLEVLKFSTREHCITGKRIANLIGLPYRASGMEGADMREIIHNLRVLSYPICAKSEGYWMAKDRDELDKFIYTLKMRVRSQQEVVAGLERADVPKVSAEEKLRELSKNYL